MFFKIKLYIVSVISVLKLFFKILVRVFIVIKDKFGVSLCFKLIILRILLVKLNTEFIIGVVFIIPVLIKAYAGIKFYIKVFI